MAITVLLIDDKEIIRTSVRLLLDSDPEIDIVGEGETFQQTVQSAMDLKPQVVVMDLHMPDNSTLIPQEFKLLLDSLGSRLIAISFWNDEDTQEFAASLGAVTLLDKMRLSTELLPAIKSATIEKTSASA
jgi:DNA-binding NarL/FixJ family response regulator